MMTQSDLQRLMDQDDATLVRWWVQLNCWEWPKNLPDPEPATYDGPDERRIQLMHAIEQRVGAYALSRYWNVDMPTRHMSDADHTAWWWGRFLKEPLS